MSEPTLDQVRAIYKEWDSFKTPVGELIRKSYRAGVQHERERCAQIVEMFRLQSQTPGPLRGLVKAIRGAGVKAQPTEEVTP